MKFSKRSGLEFKHKRNPWLAFFFSLLLGKHVFKHLNIFINLVLQIAEQCPEQQQTAMQRLLDNYHHDTETLDQELAVQRSRHLADLEAKLAARRARKLAEARRKQDEEEQQRLISEQNRQMQQGGQVEEEETDLAHVPKVQYSQSIEEQALQKEQVQIFLTNFKTNIFPPKLMLSNLALSWIVQFKNTSYI